MNRRRSSRTDRDVTWLTSACADDDERFLKSVRRVETQKFEKNFLRSFAKQRCGQTVKVESDAEINARPNQEKWPNEKIRSIIQRTVGTNHHGDVKRRLRENKCQDVDQHHDQKKSIDRHGQSKKRAQRAAGVLHEERQTTLRKLVAVHQKAEIAEKFRC